MILLFIGNKDRAVSMLTDVEQHLRETQASPEQIAGVQRRLRVTRRTDWLMPLLRPIARISLWLFRKGWHPNQLRKPKLARD